MGEVNGKMPEEQGGEGAGRLRWAAGPLRALLFWVPTVVNLGLVFLLQLVFLHTMTGVPDIADLQAQPYFSGCTVLDVAFSNDPTTYMVSPSTVWFKMGGGDSAFALYTQADGTLYVARIDRNYAFDRWGVVPWATRPVEEGMAQVPSYLGYYRLTVEQNRLADVEPVLFTRGTRTLPAAVIFFTAVGMQGLEELAGALWRRHKRKQFVPVTDD